MEHLLKTYYQHRMQQNTRDYLYDLLTFHLTPVLLAAKPAALISLSNIVKKDLLTVWDQEESNLATESITHEVLVRKNNRVSILFYAKTRIERILRQPDIRRFLIQIDLGYGEDWAQSLEVLKQRFRLKTFPHETGVFLGIPLEDVICFMNGSKNPIITGYWKVYQRPEKAQKIFEQYNNVKNDYIQHVLSGRTAEEFLLKKIAPS